MLCHTVLQYCGSTLIYPGFIMLPIQTPMRGLRCFCVAAECLSFKETAKKLYLTPSAVSHQIKQLEENLNLQLFERQTRAIVLTEVGKQFYLAIEPLMQQLATTIGEFSQAERMLEVSISMPEFFCQRVVCTPAYWLVRTICQYQPEAGNG